MAKKDKKEDMDRISEIMGEDAPDSEHAEQPEEEKAEEPEPEEKPEETKEEKPASLEEMRSQMEAENPEPKPENKPEVQQMQVRMVKGIALGFNIAIGFWLFTILLGAVVGVILWLAFGVKLF